MTWRKRQRGRKRIIGEHFRSDGEPKRRFDTREAAERFAAQHALHLTVYQCTFCGGWHFGTHHGRQLI